MEKNTSSSCNGTCEATFAKCLTICNNQQKSCAITCAINYELNSQSYLLCMSGCNLPASLCSGVCTIDQTVCIDNCNN